MSWKLKRRYRELLDREDGYVKKTASGRLRVCLAYPNYYGTGMGNLGFHAVYQLFNAVPSVLCERVFLPYPGERRLFSPGSLPLFSLETQKPMAAFDVVAFSLSFENDYPHLLDMLAMGRIPILRELRGEGAPLIVAGGIAVTMNPEPLSDFVDVFLFGEAEAVLPAFLDRLAEGRAAGLSKEALLIELQKTVTGLYAPGLYRPEYDDAGRIASFRPLYPDLPERIGKPWLPNLDSAPAERVIHSPDAAFGDMCLLEINRGCPRRCRFCAAGHLYHPPRFRRRAAVEAAVEKARPRYQRIGLVGTAASDHPELVPLCRSIIATGGEIAIGSLRVNRIDEELVGLLAAGGVETLALAPEAGSQRLRDLIRKGVDEEEIMTMGRVLLAAGISSVRLYFMVGLPTETDDDIAAIINLTERVSRLEGKSGGETRRFRRVLVSVNPFIPKAGTPMQWYPLADVRLTAKKIQRIQRAFGGSAVVEVKASPARESYLQALFSLGDRRVGHILLAAHQNRGNWPQTFKASPIDPDLFVYRTKDQEEILPWDFIDHGIPKTSLADEYGKMG
ncbi:MAG: radical SAM protein [Syntrophales bacterium]|nr:radical SAM protein [Syntrophales bacterium]